MEKALHRQRILLQHLKPSSSQTSDSPAISVRYHRKPAFDDDVWPNYGIRSLLGSVLMKSNAKIYSNGKKMRLFPNMKSFILTIRWLPIMSGPAKQHKSD
ncbi:hypothetical protein WN943_028647 [Citrus x changshan-huyou]